MLSKDAPITDVTIYPSGCLVKRMFSASIVPGSNEIVLEGLTPELDPSSIRIKGTGNVPFRNDGQDVKRTTHLETPDEKIQELLKTINELEKKKRSIKNTLEGLEKRQEWLVNIGHGFAGAYPVELAKGNSKPEDIIFTKKLFEEQLDVQATLDANRDELTIIDNTLQTVRSRLSQSKVTRASYVVKVFLENLASNEGNVQLEISYFCPRASWYSGYDLRLSEDGNESAEIDYNGLITNWTGEDWENVNMILSTAAPTLGMALPEFNPWYVRLYIPYRPEKPVAMNFKPGAPAPPPRPRMMKEKKMELDYFVADEEEAVPEPVLEEAILSSTVEKSGENLIYRLPLTVDLQSDGKPKKFLVAREKVKLEKSYYTFPANVQSVFQRGKVVNTTSMIFLPGEMNIFVGAEFAGKTSISKMLPNQSFTISLGESSSIKVLRKLKSKDVDKKGLKGKTRKHEITYTITLLNLSENQVQVTVVDSIPHPEHEDIKVTLIESLPEIKLGDLGKLEWKIDLPKLANEVPILEMEPQITYTFTLEYPREQTLENFDL
ncbi:MAG: mucoidy inhibitor MuiA family protein [Candidatus Odinarchaeota archaeon]